jgi:hypothetical protein
VKDLEKYPHIFPPLDAVAFKPEGVLSLAPTTPLTMIDSVQITLGFEGICRYIELSSSDFGNTLSPHAYFLLKMGGQPLPWYTQILQPMDANLTHLIRIQPGQVLSIWAANTTASTVAMRYRLTGWYYRLPGAR